MQARTILTLEVRGFLGISSRVITCDGTFRSVVEPSEYGKTSEIDALCWALWDRVHTGDPVTGRMVRPDAPPSEKSPDTRIASVDLHVHRGGETVIRFRRRLGVKADGGAVKTLEILKGDRWVSAGAKEALQASGLTDERGFFAFAPMAWAKTSPANNRKELREVLEKFFGSPAERDALIAKALKSRGFDLKPGDGTTLEVVTKQIRDARAHANRTEGAASQAAATFETIRDSLSELGPEPSAADVANARALLSRAEQWAGYERHLAGAVERSPDEIARAEADMAAETSPEVEAAETELRRREALVLALQAPPSADLGPALQVQTEKKHALQTADLRLADHRRRQPKPPAPPSSTAMDFARRDAEREEALAARGVCSECGAPTSHRSGALEAARARYAAEKASWESLVSAAADSYAAEAKQHQAEEKALAAAVETARAEVQVADQALQALRRDSERIAAAHRSEVEQARAYAAAARPAVDAARAALRARQAAARSLLAEQRNLPAPPKEAKPSPAYVDRARQIVDSAAGWKASNDERRKSLENARRQSDGAAKAHEAARLDVERFEALIASIREVEKNTSGIPSEIGRFRVTLTEGGVDLATVGKDGVMDVFTRGPSTGLLTIAEASFRLALRQALPEALREVIPVAIDNLQDYDGPEGFETLGVEEFDRVWAYAVPAPKGEE